MPDLSIHPANHDSGLPLHAAHNPIYIYNEANSKQPFFLNVPCCASPSHDAGMYEYRKGIILRRFYTFMIRKRQVVSEIYLMKDGNTVKVVWQNQWWRKVKGDITEEYFSI